MRYTGVTARGIITPIFKQGDDLVAAVADSVAKAAAGGGFELFDGDIVGVTEAVVGRTQAASWALCFLFSAETAFP